MKKILFSIILASALSLGAFTKNAGVDISGFEPAHIRPSSTTQYTVILKNISANIAASDIPFPSGLQIVGQSRSSSFSMGTGGNASEQKIIFTILAKKEGVYKIPAYKLKVEGEEFSLPETELKVSADAPEEAVQVASSADPFAQMRSRQIQNRQQNHSFEDSLRDKLKLELKLPKEKIYVGETVPCRLIFSCEKSLLENGFQLQQLIPQTKKADDFECAPFSGKPVIDTDSDPSKVFLTFDTAITPLKVGSYKLDFFAQGVFARTSSIDDLMGMSIIERMSSFGMSRQIPFEINMQDLTLNILPLPIEGKPAKFSGAIGNFSLEKVTVDPDSLSVGEPCIISAEIVGAGNFARISAPFLKESADWKSYKPKSSFKDESNGLGCVGIKSFEFTAVPNKADLTVAPTVIFNFFDAQKEKYVELKSKEIAVSVAPSGRSKRVEQEAQKKNEPTFGAILEKPQSSSASAGLLYSPYFWGAQILAIGAVALFVVSRRKKLRLESDPAFAKASLCKRLSESKFRAAIVAADSGNLTGFFDSAKASIQYALAAHTELDAPAMLMREAEAILIAHNADEPTLLDLRAIFEGADALAFGNIDKSDISLQKLTEGLKKIIAIAKKIKN